MVMSQIKIVRAARLSKVGRYPQTFEAVIATVGPEVIGVLSSKDLATLADRIWDSWRESKRIAAREALGEGGVWSEREDRFIPFVGRDKPPIPQSEWVFRPIV
ncbi:hypothetical protein CS379_19035 [Methylobacterium frigidaeris]|nr:hypothetical protein CS379_19035 [Methylobacterium frigidaeris]